MVGIPTIYGHLGDGLLLLCPHYKCKCWLCSVLLPQNCPKVDPGGRSANLNLTEALQQNHSRLETDPEHTAIPFNSKLVQNAI